MLRLIHNRSIVKYFLAALGLAFAFYFAWSFYPFGEWVGTHFLQDAPGGPTVLGLVSAAILGGCVLIVVFYKEYIKEDTIAYSLATGDHSFAQAFRWFVFFVLGLELFSVLFRAILLNFSPVSIVILGVGVLGMAVTYVVGKILHVQINRPPSVAARYMREEAGRSVFEEGHKLVRGKKLTTAQKRQIASGNPLPIDEVRDEKAREREREVRAAEERRRQVSEEQRQNDEFYRKMIAPVETQLVEWTRISKFPVGSDEDATEPSEPEQRSPEQERKCCAHPLLLPKSDVKSLSESRLFQRMNTQHMRQKPNGRSALTHSVQVNVYAIRSVTLCLFLHLPHLHTLLLAYEHSHFSQLGASLNPCRCRVVTMCNLSNILPPRSGLYQDLTSSPNRSPHRLIHTVKRCSRRLHTLSQSIRSHPRTRIRIRSHQSKQFVQFADPGQTIRTIRHARPAIRTNQTIRSQTLRARHRIRRFHSSRLNALAESGASADTKCARTSSIPFAMSCCGGMSRGGPIRIYRAI